MAQGRAVVAHPWANEAIVGGLLETVRDPSGGPAHREDRRGHPAREAEHPHADRQVEIEIGAQPFALPDRLLDFEGGLEEPATLALRRYLRDALEQRGARIAGRIDGVAEAGRQRVSGTEDVKHLVDASTGFEVGEHALDAIAGAAVNWSRERAEPGEHRGIEVGSSARDDACGKRRGVEFVLGAGYEHPVERLAVSGDGVAADREALA